MQKEERAPSSLTLRTEGIGSRNIRSFRNRCITDVCQGLRAVRGRSKLGGVSEKRQGDAWKMWMLAAWTGMIMMNLLCSDQPQILDKQRQHSHRPCFHNEGEQSCHKSCLLWWANKVYPDLSDLCLQRRPVFLWRFGDLKLHCFILFRNCHGRHLSIRSLSRKNGQ